MRLLAFVASFGLRRRDAGAGQAGGDAGQARCHGRSGEAAPQAAAAAASRPTPNKGDMAWMLMSHRARHHDERAGPGAVLRRHGAREEHALGADAGVRGVLADDGAVVHLRLQPRVHRGQRVLRRLRSAVPQGRARRRQGRVRHGRDLQQGRRDSGDRVRRVPGDLRGDHLLPDPRRLRRAREVLRGAGVHGALVHLRLHADRAHGVVLDGPGCLHRARSSSTS